jgi:TonB family protein
MRDLITVFGRSLCFLFLLASLVTCARGQQPGNINQESVPLAWELYHRGEVNQAIRKLEWLVRRRPDDVEAWEALATMLQQESMFGRARIALERLVSLRPDAADAHARLAYALILVNENARAISMAERALELGDHSAESHYAIAEGHFRSGAFPKALAEADIALSIKPDFLPALITKSLAHSAVQQYSEAADSLKRFLAIGANDIDAETWRSQLEELAIRAAEPPSSHLIGAPLILTGKEVHQKARVLSKPEPSYTEPARLAGVRGTVVLRAVFAADGSVKRVFVNRALGYGLTTEAVKAARLIKFTPAIKDDRPVSMFIQLEYNFNLY